MRQEETRRLLADGMAAEAAAAAAAAAVDSLDPTRPSDVDRDEDEEAEFQVWVCARAVRMC